MTSGVTSVKGGGPEIGVPTNVVIRIVIRNEPFLDDPNFEPSSARPASRGSLPASQSASEPAILPCVHSIADMLWVSWVDGTSSTLSAAPRHLQAEIHCQRMGLMNPSDWKVMGLGDCSWGLFRTPKVSLAFSTEVACFQIENVPLKAFFLGAPRFQHLFTILGLQNNAIT